MYVMLNCKTKSLQWLPTSIFQFSLFFFKGEHHTDVSNDPKNSIWNMIFVLILYFKRRALFENKSFTLYDSRQVPRRKLMFGKNCCVCHSETTLGKWGGLVKVFSPLAIPASCTYMYTHTTDVAVNTARS